MSRLHDVKTKYLGDARESLQVNSFWQHLLIHHPILCCAQVPPNIPSIGELKKTLPAHCFTPNLSLSFYYVLKDLVIMTLLYLSMLGLTEGKEHGTTSLDFTWRNVE